MSELSRLLGGKANREPEVLTDDLRKELRVIDLNSEEGIQPPAPREAQGAKPKPQSKFNQAVNALGSPAGQRFLGVMAKAFTKNDPNSAGTILGNSGISQAEGRAISNFASRLLAGEDIGDIEGMDVGGISPEGVVQAQNIASTQEQGDQRDRQLEQEDLRINLQERAMGLREDIQEYDEEVFSFEKGMSEEDMARKQRLLEIEEQNQSVQNRYNKARAAYYEAQAEVLSSGNAGDMESMTPEQKNAIFRNTGTMVELLNTQAEPLEEQLKNINNSIRRAEDSTRLENLQAEKEYLESRLANIRSSQVQAFKKMGEITGVDIEDMSDRPDAVVAPAEEGDEDGGIWGWLKGLWSSSKAGQSIQDPDSPMGSLDNPITVPQEVGAEGFPAFFEEQEPGTIGRMPSGAMYKKTEEGELIEL